jgi:hypothetical protein
MGHLGFRGPDGKLVPAKRLVVWIPEPVHSALREEAHDGGRTLTWLVGWMLERGLEDLGRKVGEGEGGDKDVA